METEARDAKVLELGKDVAMQVAAMNLSMFQEMK